MKKNRIIISSILCGLFLTGCASIGEANKPVDTKVDVTSISISGEKSELYVNDTLQLNATVLPNGSTDSSVTWSSTNSSVASVSNGLVTALAVGTTTIEAVSVSNPNVKGTYDLSVINKVASDIVFKIEFKQNSSDATSSLSSVDSQIISGAEYVSSTSSSHVYAGKNGLKLATSSYEGVISINLKSFYVLKTIDVETKRYSTNGTSALTINDVKQSITDDGTYKYTYDDLETNVISINAKKRMYLTSLTFTVTTPTPLNPTSISVAPTSVELVPGKSANLTVSYEPAKANQNKEVVWSSSSNSVTVDQNGLVSVLSTAKAGESATITAQLKNLPSIKATCEVSVVEQKLDAWTFMIYMCGADLESDSKLATADITEILAVENQPDDVNFIIETGGASSWSTKYGIKASELGRYHVENQKLVKDSSLTKANMGQASTFQSFLEWGLTEYPAQRTGVIMWNHGGAMDGVCFDENYNNDSLTSDEVITAVGAAFKTVGRTEKLEWIGYDACLMGVQDIAEFNSKYFNYMIASQETEAGEGWDYDGGWLENVYKNPTTITTKQVCSDICDTFIADNSSEATLAAYDLSKAEAYMNAWENIVDALAIDSTTKWNTLKTNVVNKCKKFGYYPDYSAYVYDVFDAQDFITKGKAQYPSLLSKWNELQAAYDNLVIYNKTTKDYSGAHGICFICCISGYNYKSYYSSSVTHFTKWLNLNVKYGSFYSGW